jgi:hypothetical protein
MSASQPRTWTIGERIDARQRLEPINPPFTDAERDLARNLAAAFYFYFYQGELPGRALEGTPESRTKELLAFDMGISRMQQIRGDIPS